MKKCHYFFCIYQKKIVLLHTELKKIINQLNYKL
jgi:hypothetical protein